MSYRIIFYRNRSGRCQACDYARRMDINHRAKANRWFQALAELGPGVPEEYGKYLQDGVWELRVGIQHHQHRFLYFYRNDVIVVTNAFLKKSQAVPMEEIRKARGFRTDWNRRHDERQGQKE